jgi:hypothetical protein
VIVPPLWSFALGALAAWSVWKLLSTDDVLDRPRDWLAERVPRLDHFLACPWCSGFWVCVLGSLGYYVVSDVPLSWGSAFGFAVTVFAMRTLVVLAEVVLDLTVAKKDEAEAEAEEGEPDGPLALPSRTRQWEGTGPYSEPPEHRT